MHGVAVALILIGVTCAAALLQPWLRLPLPFVQILAGAAAAAVGLRIQFDPHIFMLLFLPPLLFADGWATSQRELHRLRFPLLGAAVGLVFATVLAGGYFLHWLVPALPLAVAFAIAAVVSPTDATAIGGIIAKMRVSSRLRHLLESEALLNDASGLVAFRFAVAAALTGTFSWPHAAAQFILIALGGLAIGWLTGWIFIRLLSLARADESPVLVLLPALLPFGAYWLAERAEVSGILAAVAAGIAASRMGLMERAHFGTRLNSVAMWRLLIFCFNGIVFVLLGTQLLAIAGPAPIGIDLTVTEARNAVLPQIAALMAVLILVRLAWVAGSLLLQRLTRPQDSLPTWREVLALSLAGARGAVTLAGVLTLPQLTAAGAPFPGRDLAITLASGVIVLSLVIAAVALPLLLRHAPSARDPIEAELRRAREIGAEAALAALDDGTQAEGVRASVADLYRRRLDSLRGEAKPGETWLALHRTALLAERTAIQRLRDSREIDDAASRTLLRELDLMEAALARGK